MLSAGRRNQHLRIGRASPESVRTVGVQPKYGRISIEPHFRSPFEGVRSMHVGHVLPELVDVSIRTEDRSVCGIKALKKAVAKTDGRLRLIAGEEQRRATSVGERCLVVELRRRSARKLYGR